MYDFENVVQVFVQESAGVDDVQNLACIFVELDLTSDKDSKYWSAMILRLDANHIFRHFAEVFSLAGRTVHDEWKSWCQSHLSVNRNQGPPHLTTDLYFDNWDVWKARGIFMKSWVPWAMGLLKHAVWGSMKSTVLRSRHYLPGICATLIAKPTKEQHANGCSSRSHIVSTMMNADKVYSDGVCGKLVKRIARTARR